MQAQPPCSMFPGGFVCAGNLIAGDQMGLLGGTGTPKGDRFSTRSMQRPGIAYHCVGTQELVLCEDLQQAKAKIEELMAAGVQLHQHIAHLTKEAQVRPDVSRELACAPEGVWEPCYEVSLSGDDPDLTFCVCSLSAADLARAWSGGDGHACLPAHPMVQ